MILGAEFLFREKMFIYNVYSEFLLPIEDKKLTKQRRCLVCLWLPLDSLNLGTEEIDKQRNLKDQEARTKAAKARREEVKRKEEQGSSVPEGGPSKGK